MKFLSIFLTAAALVAGVCAAQAQVVTTRPAVVQTDSRNIKVTFYADRGNRGLINLPQNDAVYAHTGVITSSSTSDSDWKYAPSWGDNSAKYKLDREGTNLYSLTIPAIDTYYGVPAGETVRKLCFVFRNANNSREGKSDTNGDIYVEVYPPGLQVTLYSDAGAVVDKGATVNFTVNSSIKGTLSLHIGSVSAEPFAKADDALTLSAPFTFTTPGDRTIVAKVEAEAMTKTVTTSVGVLADPQMLSYPGGVPQPGAVRDASTGKVTFCVAAPGKKSVVLVGSWDNYEALSKRQMYYYDYQGQRYFWTTVETLAPATNYFYYYLVDGNRRVGDPYARLVLDPYNDKYIPASVYPGLPDYPADKVRNVPLAVYNSDADSYDWKVKSFKGVAQSDLVIYELLIRDFTGTEGASNASGTVAGVLSKLDYLQNLGINAIELLPIMEFDGNNSWGYNTNFYFAPDKAYGTPADYRRLIDECHARGIAVILDIVFNQSAGMHPWYQMYDIAVNPFYNGSAPHAYSVLNDWNQDNPLVEKQWADAIKYWLTAYKVDGFRFDLVKGLGDNNSYGNTYNPANNTWGTPSDAKTNAYNKSRIDRMARLHAALREVAPDAYFINEDLAGAQEENALAADGDTNWANINTESKQFALGVQDNSNLNRFYAPLDGNRTWGSTVSYMESHDEERLAYAQSRWAQAGIKGNVTMSMRRLGSTAAQMLMAPGAHMIWQFQEFGADQTTKNSDGSNNTDPKKVVWSYLNNAHRKGLMQSYTELCHLRKDNPGMFGRDVTVSMQCAAANWANGRYISLVKGNSQLIMVVNPNVRNSAKVSVPMRFDVSKYKLMSASYNTAPEISSGAVTLPQGAYAIYGTTDLSGVESPVADVADGTLLPHVSVGDDRCVAIEGEYDVAEVYTLDGRRLPLFAPLAPGVYLVVVDGRTTKVAVR